MSIDLEEIREVDRLCKQRSERDNVIDLVRARRHIDRLRASLLRVSAAAAAVGLLIGLLIGVAL